MATVDSSIYCSLALGILLTAAYTFSKLPFETVSAKIKSASGKSHKGELEQPDSPYGTDNNNSNVSTPKLSPSWWTDEEIFQIERRAIFSKSWLFITHAANFQNSGDYRTFEVAGFSFLVILGKDKQIRAFHNVCRHRAYAVTNKKCGSSTVLRCRYHGWSYDSKGKLIKAPEFENVKGFDKNLNGLWEVKTEIRESMVFVNLDAGNEVTSQVLLGVEADLRRWNVNHMRPIEEWEIKGNFNWKLAAGTLLRNDPKKTGLSAMLLFRQADEYLNVFCTTIFRRLSSGQLLTLRLLPLSKNSTTVECNLYASDSGMSRESIENLKVEVQGAIQEHDRLQNALAHGGLQISDRTQEILGELLRKHKDAEASVGAEIHPAARKQSFTEDGREDDELCRKVEEDMSRGLSICRATASGLLDW